MTERSRGTAGGWPAPRDTLRAVRLWSAVQVDRFVPARLRTDADRTRRARLLIGFSFVSVLPGAVFFALAIVNYRMPILALVTGVATSTVALTPPLLRRTGSLLLATSGMLAVFVAAMLVTAASADGQALLTLPWLAVVPLLATALAGRRAGVLWALACIVLAQAQMALDRAAVLPKQALSVDLLRVGSAWNVALLIFCVLTFAILFESMRLKAIAALSDAHTRLEAAREKALHGDRLVSLGQMAAGIAHELNNPLAFVSSNIALLREDLERGPLDPTLQRDYVEDILPATEEGIRRIIGIIGDLRRFARADTEKGVEFDFNEEVETALRMCEKSLGDCRLSVRLGKLPAIVGRPREIGQVTMNLVVNAAQALKHGGEIRVETEASGTEILLRVSDDGVGMTPEVKARVFEPFFTTKAVGEGTGLGLAVVHGIVRAHGGLVCVDSDVEGGSTFEVRLPVASSSALRVALGPSQGTGVT